MSMAVHKGIRAVDLMIGFVRDNAARLFTLELPGASRG